MSGSTTPKADPPGRPDPGTTANIPLPLGGFRPVRTRRRIVALGRARLRPTTLVTLMGMAAAVVGGVLATRTTAVPVFRDIAGVHVGGAVLAETAPGVYSGGAVVVIGVSPDGGALGAGSGVQHGARFTGRCVVHDAGPDSTVEHCDFVIAGAAVSADDTLVLGNPEVWHRTYSDGLQVDIPGAGPDGTIPVPLPIGR